MKHRLLAATAVSLSIPLGACSGGPEFNFASTSSAQQVGDIDMSDYFERRLVDGKRDLIAGRLGKAANAFRQASRHAATAAEASNGLAITYDRLGRSDLAERYFLQAVSFDPANDRFQRNLARFEGKQTRVKTARRSGAAPELAASTDTPARTSVQPARPVEHRQAVFEIRTSGASARNGETVQAQTALRPVTRSRVRVDKAPARSGFVTTDDGSVQLTRVSGNEVRIGRSETTAHLEIAPVTQPAAEKSGTHDIVYISRPVVQRIAAADEAADSGSVFALDRATSDSVIGKAVAPRIAALDHSMPTALALADVWNACRSGC
ncbi:tetratricopeptide repeat protein [Erythrobacter ani]|uniref:Tetratricopeptide repeat protein n=1 Tax=Erythrobacter ani TaxID=2827235 RepID=A0ABS6SMY2_9SPHN|nr:hypothetical protein [Erythrobacter ani]MBV7265852.1 hypothetical protein [Erythrobacter ani]